MRRELRKAIRRLRATFPDEQRRGVRVERTAGGRWRVVLHGSSVLDHGRTLAVDIRRATALHTALTQRGAR